MGEAQPQDLLYICRTSLASLFAPPLHDVETSQDLPPELGAFPHRAMVADLHKTALGELIAHQPTHIIFDFIDERLDLLAVQETLVTHSWELEVSGYLGQPAFKDAHTIARTSAACELLWRQGLREMAALIDSTPLADAHLILHQAQWATRYRDETAQTRDFASEVEIFTGKSATIADHNAVLENYEAAFLELLPRAARVAAPPALRLADASHRWGLSPFHYVEDYYREVWRQFQALGI